MDIKGEILRLAAEKSARREKLRVDPVADQVWRWIKTLPDANLHRPLMKFARWLWNTGTHDPDFLIELLKDRISRNPSNPYAYYAPHGPARSCKEAARNILQAEIDNDRLKAEERAWLETR